MSPRRLALLVIGVAAFSFSSILIRWAAAPALAIAFSRNAMAAVFLQPTVLVAYRGELRGRSRRQWGIFVLAGLHDDA